MQVICLIKIKYLKSDDTRFFEVIAFKNSWLLEEIIINEINQCL